MNLDQLKQICPSARYDWAASILDQMPKWKVLGPVRESYFLAQFAVETKGLSTFEEDLAYSVQGLIRTWPAHFAARDASGNVPPGKVDAADYAYKPEKLANYIYADANRDPHHALGNVSPGDGWLYRGRGPQATGRAVYKELGRVLGQPLEQYPELLLRPSIGAAAMGYFWSSRHCNELADAEDFEGVTRAINGGLIGLAQRADYRDKFMSVFAQKLAG